MIGSTVLGVNQGTCPKTDTPNDFRKANLHCGSDYYIVFINTILNV
jgi:hypothetical protein